jgi:Protein of unknown function (DUF3040)
MALNDDERRRLADIEHRLDASDPQLADALSRRRSPRRAWPRVSVDAAVAVGLGLAWLAAALDHALLAITALITTVVGIWLALRHDDSADRQR